MFEGTDSVLNIKSVSSNISYKSFKFAYANTGDAKFLYYDHRNFDIV
jgi:hypothetical protein